ncbi:MAG: phosphoribosylformylglycinamidine synthase subunit PurL [Coriobacteriia bacterium]|nr:phosphoribosylformylglycinamidine synthase subunit PurL [Coriobacteriia bacterium]
MIPVTELTEQTAPELAVELGLTLDEYAKITDILGRVPSTTELYMYSLMWSEHCSYKTSGKYLKTFPTEGEHVLQGPGENAGVISAGDGLALAFKMESHNHPSAIDPFEGAGTGIGGCARDIFAMGARPIAFMGSTRFGSLDSKHQRWLFEEATKGIASYSVGMDVPTVAGEVYFEDAYAGNCLINAMVIGLLREENLTRAQAHGVGNKVILIGLPTGREGIGGASVLASAEFVANEDGESPSVDVTGVVGNPDGGRRLSEVSLELLEKGLLIGLGDLGAAGLTSSASEMASRAGTGIEIDVDTVPQKEEGMEPHEIMVSETQERMLAVIDPKDLEEVEAICAKWELPVTVVGQVTDTGNFVVRAGDVIHGVMPAHSLAEEAPPYDPEVARPDYLDELAAFDIGALDHPQGLEALNETLLKVLGSSNICSRQWAYEKDGTDKLDQIIVAPGNDAAVVRIGEGDSTLSFASCADCNGRYAYLDPYRGAQIALAESARNVSCVGAKPAAITDCLNFGSPEKPEVFWTFVEAIRGIADGCKALDVPVISGNVSFYNESSGVPIYPTPVIGMVGLLDSADESCTLAFKDYGDVVILVGETADELGGSEYLNVIHNVAAGVIPALDLELERDVQTVVRDLIHKDLVKSAHDCSDGGIAVALAESCIAGEIGATIVLDNDLSAVSSLFSESQSRIIITCESDDVDHVIDAFNNQNVPFSVIGEVGGDRLMIDKSIDLALDEITPAYNYALEKMLVAE